VAVSPELFSIVAACGCCALAFWFCTRFPERGPSTVWFALVHLAFSAGVAQIATTVLPWAIGSSPLEAVPALTLLVVAPLTYIVVSAMWVIRAAVLSSQGRLD
jgi:hypothetical protein